MARAEGWVMRPLLRLDRDLGLGDFGRRRRRLRVRAHADQSHGRLHHRLVLLGEQRGSEQQREHQQQQQRAADEHLGCERHGIGDLGRASRPHRSLPLGPERPSASAARPECAAAEESAAAGQGSKLWRQQDGTCCPAAARRGGRPWSASPPCYSTRPSRRRRARARSRTRGPRAPAGSCRLHGQKAGRSATLGRHRSAAAALFSVSTRRGLSSRAQRATLTKRASGAAGGRVGCGKPGHFGHAAPPPRRRTSLFESSL